MFGESSCRVVEWGMRLVGPADLTGSRQFLHSPSLPLPMVTCRPSHGATRNSSLPVRERISIMAFGTTGRSDTRRRRLLMGSSAEADVPEQTAVKSKETASNSRRCYHAKAARDAQPALTRLIPHRRLTHFVLASLGLAIGFVVIDAWIVRQEGPAMLRAVDALDPWAAGSLADWSVSLGLLSASATMALIYLVRRHRVDDYKGRYRLWLWAAVTSFAAAADSATHLTHDIAGLAAPLTEQLAGTCSVLAHIWPLVIAALLAVGLAWEMFESKVSVAWLALAAASMVAAATLATGWLSLADPVLHELVTLSSRLLAVWSLLGGLFWYARHVDRVANGLVEAGSSDESEAVTEPKSTRKRRKRRQPAVNEEADESQEDAADDEPTKGAPVKSSASRAPKRKRRQAAKPQPAVEPDPPPADDEEEADADMEGLSKAERRRLRKLKRRQRRRQAA